MEYLYIAMFLQELEKEINEANIQKIFAALGTEIDSAKVQFLILALSILTTANHEKAKSAAESSRSQQPSNLQKLFETLENSITIADEMSTNHKRGQTEICEASVDKEKAEESVELEKSVKTDSFQQIEHMKTNAEICVIEHNEITNEKPARYVYGIANQGVREHLGAIGLDGAEVYTIPYKDICVVVHDCLAEPYKSEDETVVKDWLFTQQEVLDAVAEKFEVVLPMSFDIIIEGKNRCDPEQTVKDWMEKNYEDFHEKMVWLRNKQEFGVQVILDTESLSEKLLETDEKLNAKKKEIDSKPEGIAYIERELLKELLKEKIEEEADKYFRDFYSMIKKYTADIVIGKAKKVGGNKQMLMNLSCLVGKDMVAELGKELENIENMEGISVRFSGPWAPYSFVTPEKGVAKSG